MAEIKLHTDWPMTTFKEGRIESGTAWVVMEKPLTVFLNHNEFSTMVCSPGAYEELAVGFLLSEGILHSADDIEDIRCRQEQGLLWIETKQPVTISDNFLRRHMASCCGKGRAGLYFINDARQLEAVNSDFQLEISTILELMSQFEEKAELFRLTGGVHSAALAGSNGLVAHFEDIGRHNAVDKVLGYAILNRIDTTDKFLLLSGRIASEILIKAARGNVPIIVSRSAPTQLTLELADELNICIIGFARGQTLNIYTHPERVLVEGREVI